MATAFVDTALVNNLRIPGDTAVLGYDDLPMCRNNNPTISSVRADFQQLGMATIQALKNPFPNNGHQHSILSLIPVSISEREFIETKNIID